MVNNHKIIIKILGKISKNATKTQHNNYFVKVGWKKGFSLFGKNN